MLFSRSKGQCSHCNSDLDDGWHADHIEPFSKTGRTNVFEMQALCPACNLRKGAKSMEVVVKDGRQARPPEFDKAGFRDAQRKLFLAVGDALRNGEKEIGIHLHIRGGKTMLMRLLAKWAVDNGFVSVAMIVNNRAELRRQCADNDAFKQDCTRVGVNVGREHPAYNMVKKTMRDGELIDLDGFFPADPWQNNEYILSTSIQTLTHHEGQLSSFIDSVHHRGLPLLVFVDEAQEFGTEDAAVSQGWERVIDLLRAKGVTLISLSGFPHREDGKTIPGFFKSECETKSSTRTIFAEKLRDISDNEKVVLKEVRDIDTEYFDLRPIGGEMFEFPLSVGFDTASLCSIYEEHITRKVTLIEDDEIVVNDKALSELSASDAKKSLRQYLFHEDVIADGCEKMEIALNEKRRAVSDIKAMVFTCSDGYGKQGADEHAKMVKDWIDKNTDLSSVIVTGNSSDDMPASQMLMQFKSDDSDVIILKNVGRVGFDCPRAKVLLDLSDIRSQGKAVQTWLRVSTPHEGISASVIHPNDPRAAEHFKAAIGCHMDRLKRSSSTVIDSFEDTIVLKSRSLLVGEKSDSVMSDNENLTLTSEQRKLVSAHKKSFPMQIRYMERETLPKQWADFVKPYLNSGGKLDISKAEEDITDAAVEAAKIRVEIFGSKGDRKTRALIDRYMQMRWRKPFLEVRRDGREGEWFSDKKSVIYQMKAAAGLASDVKPDEITSPKTFGMMKDFIVRQMRAAGDGNE